MQSLWFPKKLLAVFGSYFAVFSDLAVLSLPSGPEGVLGLQGATFSGLAMGSSSDAF